MGNDFLEFLRDEHAKEYTGNGDDIGIAFEDWLGNLDTDTWLLYGDIFGRKLLAKYKKELQIQKTITSPGEK